MTAMQMNAELFRQLSLIADDEPLMAKVLNYIKKLTHRPHHSPHPSPPAKQP